jgi:hypothetical protein
VRWPRGGRPGDDAKGGFSEGRTLCVRMVWPNVCRGIPFSRDGRAKPGHPRGHARMEPRQSLRACGARPSARASAARMALRGKLGDDAKGGFSEGRTLCVRVARPRECQDIAFPPGAFTIAPQSKRGMLRLARCFPLRACGARPSAGGQAQDRSPSGESPEMTRKAVSRRDALCASALRGSTNAKTLHSRRVRSRSALNQNGAMLGLARCFPLRACGARPSAGRPSDGEKALRGQTRRWRERRFSRRDALCASALRGPTNAKTLRSRRVRSRSPLNQNGGCWG